MSRMTAEGRQSPDTLQISVTPRFCGAAYMANVNQGIRIPVVIPAAALTFG